MSEKVRQPNGKWRTSQNMSEVSQKMVANVPEYVRSKPKNGIDLFNKLIVTVVR
jgi:hypothetical protein